MATIENILENITKDKTGVEIGGPSQTGPPIYKSAKMMDNIVFSKTTVWRNHTDEYNFYQNKTGKVIINDSVNIKDVEDNNYDFVFSSHCLEHIANPMKALQEMIRITKPRGYIIIVVPEKSVCFDHRRQHSKFSTILSQYHKNVGEDDLSTLPEILRNHDLISDGNCGNFENFTKRSLNNFENRCLHHYVYSPDLLMEMCNYFKCDFVHTETIQCDMYFIMKKPNILFV